MMAGMSDPRKLDYGREPRREIPAFVVALGCSLALLVIVMALPFASRLLSPLLDPLVHWLVGDLRR